MSEWQEVKLGELIDINQSSIGRNYEFENIRYYDISSIGIGVAEDPKNLSRSEAPSRAKRIIKDGDIILATVRPGNRSFYYFKQTRENDIASTGFAVISPRNNLIDNKFLYYLISAQSFTNYLVSNEQGATYPAITPSVINRAKINLPPLPTQQKIAKILSNYDDLIENNLKRIKLLEESARLTYEEWFLRFRIDGKKLEIDPETKLPFGWMRKKAEEALNVNIGKTPPRGESHWFTSGGQGMKWISIKDMKQSSTYTFNSNEEITKDGVTKHNMNIAQAGVVLLSFKLTVGEVRITVNDVVTNEAIAHMNIKKDSVLFNEYIYSYLQSFNFDTLGSTSSIGTAINSKIVKAMPVIIPSNEILEKFKTTVVPTFSEINNLQHQNQLLKEARDILLPRLMTGMIDTDDMDIAV